MAEAFRPDRRSFLKSMGVGAGVAGAASVVGTPALVSTSAAAAATAAAPFSFASASTFKLEVDGKAAGYLGAEGGWPYAEVEEEDPGEGKIPAKHISNIKFEDISLAFGPGIKPVLTDRISDMLNGNTKPFGGVLINVTNNFREHSRLTFENAYITEVSIPALDAASKDAAKMTVKLSPEVTLFTHTEKQVTQTAASKQKKWLVSNFRLEIEGLECRRVNKIESFTIKQKVIVDDSGKLREPAKIEFPNITIHATDDAAGRKFYDWFNSAISSPEGDERPGSITLLGTDLKTVLGVISLVNLGPVKVEDEQKSENIRRVKAEMYCEQITFKYTEAWA